MPLEETKIVVTKEEWEEAEKFFQENPDEVKFRKVQTVRGKKEGHSFVKIAGDIYALNNVSHTAHEADAGAGAFGRVKRAINQKGEMIVIKIESKEMKEMSEGSITSKNEQLMIDMGYLLARIERDVRSGESGNVKAQDPIRATTKVLTAFQYRGNKELAKEKFSDKGVEAINFIYALKAMMGIASLHRGGILHRDIKAENFVLNGQGAGLTVMPIDFDFSHKLSKGKKGFKDNVSLGTSGFMAPEIDKEFNYSFASDVYALGNMFKTQLFLPKGIYESMMATDPNDRMPLQAAMQAVVTELSKPKYKDNPEVKAVLEEYKKQEAGVVNNNPEAEAEAVAARQEDKNKKEAGKGMNIGKSISTLYEKIKNLPKKTIKTTPVSEPLVDLPTVPTVLPPLPSIPTHIGGQPTFVHLPPLPLPLIFSPSMQKKETTKDIQESLQVFLEKIFEKALPEQLASLKGVLEMARNSLKSVNANPRDIIMYLDLEIKKIKDKPLPGKNVELDDLEKKLTEFKERLDKLAPAPPSAEKRPALSQPNNKKPQ